MGNVVALCAHCTLRCIFGIIHQICIIPIQNKVMVLQFHPHGAVDGVIVVACSMGTNPQMPHALAGVTLFLEIVEKAQT